MKTFNNIEEAKEEIKRLKEKTTPSFFCPLINKTCRKDCICIGEPRYVSNAGGYGVPATSWTVYSWWCTNGMFQERPQV